MHIWISDSEAHTLSHYLKIENPIEIRSFHTLNHHGRKPNEWPGPNEWEMRNKQSKIDHTQKKWERITHEFNSDIDVQCSISVYSRVEYFMGKCNIINVQCSAFVAHSSYLTQQCSLWKLYVISEMRFVSSHYLFICI